MKVGSWWSINYRNFVVSIGFANAISLWLDYLLVTVPFNSKWDPMLANCCVIAVWRWPTVRFALPLANGPFPNKGPTVVQQLSIQFSVTRWIYCQTTFKIKGPLLAYCLCINPIIFQHKIPILSKQFVRFGIYAGEFPC